MGEVILLLARLVVRLNAVRVGEIGWEFEGFWGMIWRWRTDVGVCNFFWCGGKERVDVLMSWGFRGLLSC